MNKLDKMLLDVAEESTKTTKALRYASTEINRLRQDNIGNQNRFALLAAIALAGDNKHILEIVNRFQLGMLTQESVLESIEGITDDDCEMCDSEDCPNKPIITEDIVAGRVTPTINSECFTELTSDEDEEIDNDDDFDVEYDDDDDYNDDDNDECESSEPTPNHNLVLGCEI